jgi:hypothetical protein
MCARRPEPRTHRITAVTTKAAFAEELRRAIPRMGGTRGFLLLAVLAMISTLIPGRLGQAFLDPTFQAAYAALAFLFAGSYAAQGFAGERERQFLINWSGDPRPVVLGKVLAAGAWGWLCWLLIYGVSLAFLGASAVGGAKAPPLLTLLGVAALAAGAAWVSAAAGAAIGLSVFSPVTARQLLRLGFFFILLLLLTLPRLLPDDIQASLRALLGWEAAGKTLLITAAALGLVGLVFYRRALSILTDLRTGLSITS